MHSNESTITTFSFQYLLVKLSLVNNNKNEIIYTALPSVHYTIKHAHPVTRTYACSETNHNMSMMVFLKTGKRQRFFYFAH